MWSGLFTFSLGSNRTRLLNTAMKGWFTEIVDSSWIEALGGLSRCEMRNVPPDFWAKEGTAAITQAAQDAAKIAKRKRIDTSSQADANAELYLSCLLRRQQTICNALASRRRGPLRRAFELDLVALGIVEIHRETRAFRTITLDRFAHRNAERRKPAFDARPVERLDAEAQVIHVAARDRPFAQDQVEHRGPGAHLHQAEPLQPTLDLEAQRLLVEPHHRRQVADPQHDMVDPFDMESHGS